ncbi:MAG TPA: S4 domain-containing protein [Candidatus Dormibacteraeota bacterium]|nr:S4 domain-containing protein [Candidatus Dormibacteraeota bacterium]
MEERLQKIIARAGIASRRHAEDLIRSGMVTVNGRTVTELGSKADEATDHIKVSGKLIHPGHDRVYLVLNKPPEVVSTMSDPEGRRSLQDLLHGVPVRVFPVGRLEYHSMGLVFLTNDGELANRMLKAHRLRQTYLLKLKSLLTFQEIEQLARSTGARITRVRGKESPWYEVTLTEARRDALRNRLFQTGHPVEKIKRVRVGSLELGSLQPGEHRTLSSEEIAALSRAIEGKLEPASEPPIKRTQVKRPAKSAATRRGGERRPDRKSERQPGSNVKRQGRSELTKRLRTKPRKAR